MVTSPTSMSQQQALLEADSPTIDPSKWSKSQRAAYVVDQFSRPVYFTYKPSVLKALWCIALFITATGVQAGISINFDVFTLALFLPVCLGVFQAMFSCFFNIQHRNATNDPSLWQPIAESRGLDVHPILSTSPEVVTIDTREKPMIGRIFNDNINFAILPLGIVLAYLTASTEDAPFIAILGGMYLVLAAVDHRIAYKPGMQDEIWHSNSVVYILFATCHLVFGDWTDAENSLSVSPYIVMVLIAAIQALCSILYLRFGFAWLRGYPELNNALDRANNLGNGRVLPPLHSLDPENRLVKQMLTKGTLAAEYVAAGAGGDVEAGTSSIYPTVV